MILYIIFYFSLGYTFWMLYEIIKHYQGDKIVKYLQHQRYRAKVLRDYERIQFDRMEKMVKRLEVQECEVEDYEWDIVDKQGNRQPPNEMIVLDITNSKAPTIT